MFPSASRVLRAATLCGVLLAAAVLVVSCVGAPPARDLQPTRTAAALEFHSGKRTDQDGIPLLDLSGSSYEVGLQYGVLLRPEIRAVHGEFKGLLDELTGGGLRLFFFRHSLDGKIDQMRAALPAEFLEEIRGIADGAQIPFDEYLFFAVAPELLFDPGCTSIVVRRGDQIVHGRNFDFPRPANIMSRYPVIVKSAVDGKVPFINVGFAGLPGVYTGFNSHGIAASVNTASFTKKTERNFVPVGFLVKSVLEDCSSLAEVDAVMRRSVASHYFITVSSRDERSAALYESLGGSATKVEMTQDVLSVANAPLSAVNRQRNASILSQAEYNLAREREVGLLAARKPQAGLADYVHDILGNHDFYSYPDFPAHQTPIQDSLKTINNYNTIQSVIIDWPENLLIFSYCSSYAGFGSFHAYDISSGQLSLWRPEDPFSLTSGFRADTGFLESAFSLVRSKGMSLDKDGWEKIQGILAESEGLNPLLRADWTFSASMALKSFDEAGRAARGIDRAFPDYYLGPLDQGFAAYKKGDWQEARECFLESESRPINSPATRLLAIAYASLASGRLHDGAQAARLREQARELLSQYWIPPDLDQSLKSYIRDGEVAELLHGIARDVEKR